MSLTLLAALGSVLLLAPAGTLEVSDAVQVYARHRQAQRPTTMDLDDLPQLTTELAWPTTTLALQYAPQLAWLDVLGTKPPMLLLHNASLNLLLRQPRYTLSLTQTGMLGQQDFTQLGIGGVAAPGVTGATGAAAPSAPTQPLPPSSVPTTGTNLDLLPNVQVVRVATEDTRLDLRYLWSPRWTSDFNARFGLRGGAGAAARTVLPRERTAELGGSLDYLASQRDVLGSTLTGTQFETSNGYTHWLASLQERWARQLTHSSNLELGAGVAFQDSMAPDGTRSGTWSPTGHAQISSELLLRDLQAHFSWDTAFAPQINPVLGTLQSRVQTDARASLTLGRTSVGVDLVAAQTLPLDASGSTRLLSASLAADQAVLDWLDLQAGARILWQRSNLAVTVTQSVWLLYAGLAGHAPPLSF